jgi:hypothetical protein
MALGTNTIFWQRKPFYLNSTVESNEIQKLVMDGDSLAFATFGIFYLYRRPPAGINLAVPGDTIADMDARAATFDAELATNACGLIWCGTNTLAGEPDTIAGGNDAADQLFAYMDDRVAAGWDSATAKIFMINCLARGNSPPGFPQTARTQFNTRLAAEAALHSSGAAIDVTNLPGTPGDDRYFNVDLVHGNPIGYQWLHAHTTAPFLYSVRF